MRTILIALISVYRVLISPILEVLFGKACKFNPTCSQYTLEMVKKHGATKGLLMGMEQLSRCHSFSLSLR